MLINQMVDKTMVTVVPPPTFCLIAIA
jgi:hypothetical protein